MNPAGGKLVTTTCASHCGGSCVLKAHVKDGAITRIESADDAHFRACLRGRAYRQRVYDQNRILHPLKRVGARGEGKLARISWDEALDTVAAEIKRVDPASRLVVEVMGDVGNVNTPSQIDRVLAAAGGFTMVWGVKSFQQGIYAQRIAYGVHFGANTRDDLPNSNMIVMWGWNPVATISGISTNWHLAKARELGAKIVAVDPRFTDSAALFAQQWIPIRPTTDGAMLLAMAHTMIEENLQDQKFLDKYTVGFDKFRDYVMGWEDGTPKTPRWAEEITGVAADTIVTLARDFATIKPAALLAGIAPGRTANGDQYHRIAITLAAMTGNIGIHGGDSAGRAWESIVGGYPYEIDGQVYFRSLTPNPVDDASPRAPRGAPPGFRTRRVHYCDVPDFIEKGKAGGFHADCKLLAVVHASYVNCIPNVNRIIRALKSDRLEFIFLLEQVLSPTTRYADIILPTNTFLERNDFVKGVGLAFYGSQAKAVEPLGESKSPNEIAALLAERLDLKLERKTDEEWIKEMLKQTPVRDYEAFRRRGIERIPLSAPFIAFKENIDDPDNHPFPTPSGKIEIFSEKLLKLNNPEMAPIPKYVHSWEGFSDPLRARYPMQMISTHFKRRANNQFETVPWLRELERQAVMMSTADAAARGIRDGDLVRIFNDRGAMIIPALVTERIMPGVVDVPHGAWYCPDDQGIDRGGCANVLTKDSYSPGGGFAFNSCLVQIERSQE